MKKLLGALPVLVLLLTLCPAWGVELPVQAEAALLMEKETGQVLYAKNEHQALEPASVTKVMTLLLVMEAIDRGTLAYDDVVTVSDYAASMGGSQIFLSPGEQITVEDLLKGVCVSSGNDAAVALAEKTAGVTELFVEQMNNRARELGMQDTHFVNCTGLPAEGHVTSAWDIAVMSRELIRRHPDIRRFTTIWMDTLRDGQFQLSNTNKLIRFYEGATGLKTGSTDSARYCISAPEEPLPPVPVQLGAQGTVQPRVDPAEGLLLAEKSRLQGLEQTVTLPESAAAPVRQGDILGTLTVTQNGETLLEVPIRAAETVEKLTFGEMFLRLARTMCFCG